jgi:hypothetical protein
MSVTSTAPRPQVDTSGAPQPAPAPWLRLTPEDGWLTVVLLAALVYFTVSSIQAVTPPWAPGLQILTTTTGVGLILGYLVTQQGRLPSALAHSAAIVLGVVFAFKQTADIDLDGDWRLLLTRLATWFRLAFIEGRGSSDNAVFLLFLGILTFLLAYISYWLVIETRRPWLAVLANGTVLLINLNWATDSLIIFLVMFLLATMLLLVRFTLAENMRRWRARGLRFSPDLGWDFMQAGAILAVVVMLLAYLLPIGAANAQVMHALNDPQGTWQRLQERVAFIFGGVVGPKGPGNGSGSGLFGTSIHLQGKVVLPDTVIFHYTTNDGGDPGQYLLSQTLDSYDGISTWTQSESQQTPFAAGQLQPSSSKAVTTDSFNVTFDTIYGDGQHALIVPGSEPAQFSIASYSNYATAAQMPVSWEAQRSLPEGQTFKAVGYVSQASIPQLRAVPYPLQAANADPSSTYYYSPDLLNEYERAGTSLSPEIQRIAQDATKGTTNMYDAAVAIEDYLRTFTYSTDNPDPPPSQDATLWFLHTKQGYCTFFASAMALMGRSLGMPTRVASGFIDGNYDSASNSFIVKGTASHAWTQIYFAKYGWVNFEPTSSFSKFARAVDLSGATPTAGSTTPGANGNGKASPTPKDITGPEPIGGGNGPGGAAFGIALGGSIFLLLTLLAAALALIWWRLLFRGLPLATAAFGRVARLGSWAGAPPDRTQTPIEYGDRLSEVAPGVSREIRQLTTAYSRERYGGGVPDDVAARLPSLYDEVRRRLAGLIRRRLTLAPLTLLRRRSARGPRLGGGSEGATASEIERSARRDRQ